jgi:hypothetical protein
MLKQAEHKLDLVFKGANRKSSNSTVHSLWFDAFIPVILQSRSFIPQAAEW